MPAAVDVLGVLVRFVYVGAACLLTGIFAFLLLAGRSAIRAAEPATRDRVEGADRRLLALALVTLGVIMGAGLLDLARQALVATAGGPGGLGARSVVTLLAETRYGDVWLARHALWLLLAALLLFRGPQRDPRDWLALRLAGLVLAAAGLVAGAASGHAASAPESPGRAMAADAVHLLAAGIWAGALVPLALFLRWTRAAGPGAAPAAAVAVRRFSTLGLLSVVALVASGIYGALQQVDSLPALLGTAYGQWLCFKLGLLPLLLAVAFVNRARLRPRLERAVAEPAAGNGQAGAIVLRLGRLVLLEALLVSGIFVAVAVLGLTTPARHGPIGWPLPFRFAWDTTWNLPGVRIRAAVGSQLAIVGLLAALFAIVVRGRWWRPALVGAILALLIGLAVALPPLAVDAYPTTYLRPAVPYTVASIARGHTLYRGHCVSCHGADGTGDGPAAGGAGPRPPDLTGRHAASHTAGDLFWWVTHGVRGSRMPAFGDRLAPEQRWDIVNFLRALAAAEQGRGLTPLAAARMAIVAPDVGYTTGVGDERSLRDYRGQTIVLLVFFQLPDSLERLARLGRRHFDFRVHGAEIIGVPLEAAGTVYRTIGSRPALFPFVIEGAEQAAAAYGLFRKEGRRPDARMPGHMEFLIDRQGYLRARWLPPESPDAAEGWSDVDALLKEVGRLGAEVGSAPAPGEYVD